MPDLWDKKYVCPICGSQVASKKVFTDKVRIKEYDPDMKPNYEGVNVLLYSVVVCNQCHYAALDTEFENHVSPIYLDQIREIQRKIKIPDNVSFSAERDHRAAILSYALAALFYEAKKQPCRTAEMYLRIAWLYRELKDKENEYKALARSLLSFEECYSKANISEEKEPMVLFYLGELSYRLGKMEDARRWFSILINKYRNSNSYYVKAGRDRWQEIKE
ncbi:DUF2225 domain-containing protein [Fervidobacterium sp. 2310opik-2]|uniref:DUF2225 domain-containing protein n=1 Tax=Fervidobacterium sp. 2310opik-2 TaxID=1755815 RepID=UPI0013DEB259|nr:DUF2225 domain-containing protein [Fervidobacterium sp. 2310opik-2]KAF2961855.1 hypothetical protein AS161_07095 [Fervidobacterium sp. 2310opik-2]